MPSNIGNYYERLVMERIQQAVAAGTAPNESVFIEDLACVALNSLPPRYIRHSIDFAYHLTDAEHAEMQQEVEEAVQSALGIVQRRHEQRDAEDD